MIIKALLAYLHYLSIITLIVTLVVELVIFERHLSGNNIKKLQKTDAIYGLSAIMVLITGTLRIYIYGNGLNYYLNNYLFVTKISLFLLVGLLSIYPTIVFLRWRKLPDDQQDLILEEGQYKKLLRFIRLEVILVFMIPLFAALMARGIGF